MCNAADPFAGLESEILTSEPKPHAGGDRPKSFRGQLLTADDAKKYILAGKSVVTLVSIKTGARFSYRISVAPDGMAYFVSLLNGPDNTTDYKYLGRIARDIFWLGRKLPRPGDISSEAPSAKAFDWAWRQLAKGTLPAALEIWHEGKCGRCGRKLTVPESIAQGFGPECANKLGPQFG